MEPDKKTVSEGVVHDFDYWKDQIQCALDDVDYKKFVDRGNKIEKRYLDKRDAVYADTTSLNLFHSNVVTLRSMLFGQSPRVQVDRRHDDEDDDIARVGTEMLERMLNNDIGLRTDRYAFALRKCLDDYLIVGLGQARVRYSVTLEGDAVKNETAPTDYVYWKDFLWGPCRNWDECPWVAFRSYLKEGEVAKAFGEKAAKDVEYKSRKLSEDESKTDKMKSAEVWEVWCKETRQTYWICLGGVEYVLKEQPDPLRLKDFFPCPQPMMANLTNTKLMPTADFVFAQDLYNEIDQLESRIVILTKAVKVVGVYDKQADGLTRMLKEGTENDLIPVDNWAMFAEKGGLKGVVDWLPIEAVVTAIEKLREYRDEAINLLYQVTGMSDIMRGQSTERRTSATEQSLKAKFASVRIQFLQDMFANFATDLQVLKADIVSTHYDPQTIVKQSNMKFDQKNALFAQPAVQMIKNRDEMMWRVRVRPESVAMVDYAQLKQERTEFINALAVFFQSAVPLFQQDPTSAPFMFKLLQWGLAGFKGSQQIEGVMDQAIQHAIQRNQTQGSKPSPEEQKNTMEMQKMVFEGKLEQQKAQQEFQMEQLKAQQEMQQDRMKFQQEMQQDQQKFMLEMRQLMMKANLQAQIATKEAETKMMTAEAENEMAEDAHVREQARMDDAAERETARKPSESDA